MLLQERQDGVPNARAHERLVGVGGVVPGGGTFGFANIQHVGAAQREEGAQVGYSVFDAHGRHSGEGTCARTAPKPQEHGFRLVVKGMPQQNSPCTGTLHRTFKGAVTGGSRRHFGAHTALRNLHALREHRVQPQVRESFCGGCGDLGGVGLQSVVDHDGAHTHIGTTRKMRSNAGERERIWTAAACNQHEGFLGFCALLRCGRVSPRTPGTLDGAFTQQVRQRARQFPASRPYRRMQPPLPSMLHVLSFSVVCAAVTKSIRKFLRALRQMQQRITHY